jgi:stage II sporulation protein E
MIMFEAAICLISAYLFSYSMPLLVRAEKKPWLVTNESFICVILLLSIAISGFSGAKIFSSSISGVMGSLLILSVAFCGNMGSGGAAGVIIGLTMGLSGGQAFPMALYALSGVLAGCFRTLSKYAVTLGYLLGSIIIVLYFGRTETAAEYISEAALAGVIFLLIPKKYLALWRERIIARDSGGDEQLKEAVNKLYNISQMFNDLGGVGINISEDAKLRLREEEIARALSQVGEKVCQECTERSTCWEDNFYNTSQSLLDMLELAERNRLLAQSLPRYIKESCIKKTELMGTVKLVADYNETQGFWRKKMFKERQLVSEQIKAAAQIIKNLAQEISKEPQVNKPMAAKLQEKAASLDCQLDKVLIKGKGGTTVVEITKQPCNGRRECVNTVLPLAAGLLREKMVVRSKCGTARDRKPCKITMQAAKNYTVATAVASAAKAEGAVNGDNSAVLPLSGGKLALLLSDGMGSGCEAAGESSSAIKFLRKMLEMGFAIDVAVETVNAMLLLKSPEEKFATLDMLIVDLYSAEGEFLKIGAAPSYVKRVREVGVLKRNSLPIGILNNIEIDPIKVQLAAGDIIVMISDGIADAPSTSVDKELWLSNILRCMPETNPKDIAERVLAEAKRAAGGKDQDDMTVLCVKLDQKAK